MQVASLFRETASLLGESMDLGPETNCAQKQENMGDGGPYDPCIEAPGHPGVFEALREPSHMDNQSQMDHHHQKSPYHNFGMKLDPYGDPYNFEDELVTNNSAMKKGQGENQPKKRGRKKKIVPKSDDEDGKIDMLTREESLDSNKDRKRHDRFNGLSEEEVSRRTLPDHLRPNLDIVIVGINPGLFAAYKGHHYAGPGNHFWKCLHLSGLIPEPLTADDDYNLVRFGIGFTNIVSRPTKGSADLTRREIKNGCQMLLDKLQKFRPKVAVFNGKLIYEIFSGKKDFPFGRQTDFIEGTNTYIWVMPSSSARCAQLPRAADKVPYYIGLKKFRDYLNGHCPELPESEFVFAEPKSMSKAGNAERNGGGEGSGEVPFNPFKKKRGRPRKGMEKASLSQIHLRTSTPEEALKGDGEGLGLERNAMIVHPAPGKKKRGRPKKDRSDTCSAPKRVLRSASPDITDGPGAAAHHTQTNSSVSSGYSSGTSGSTEDRGRGDSLSNAGSGGPSPSHHSFTTQSDLSSEISAAISCGSPPHSHSPNNGQGQSQGVNHTHNHQGQQIQESFDHGISTSSGGTSGTRDHETMNNQLGHLGANGHYDQLMGGGGGGGESPSPYSLSYHHHSYDERLHHLNRSHSQQTSTYQQSVNPISREDVHPDLGNGPPPNGSNPPSYHPNAYSSSSGGHTQPPPTTNNTTTKAVDLASKSISGLESLVDQIPSIADSDMGISSAAAVMGSIDNLHNSNHSHSMSMMGQGPGGHYGGGESSGGPGFIPYTPPPHSYPSQSHYPHYYPSELSSGFPSNSLGPNYCSPSPSSPILLGYPGYHHQYPPSTNSGYPHHGPTYNNYTSHYPGPNPYSSSLPPPPPPNGNHPRFPQRLHHSDLGHLGFGGF